MGKFNDLEELGRAVDEADNQILLCDAIDLRDVCGESRLKALARERIKERLASRGLVALPEVPEYQENPVYVTRQSSPADLLYKAFFGPSAEGLERVAGAVGGTGEVAGQQEAAKQIAELLDEARSEVERMIGAEVTE